MEIPPAYKKAAAIIAFLAVAAIAAILIYTVFFKSEPTIPTPDGSGGTGTSTAGRLPESGPGSTRIPGRTGEITGDQGRTEPKLTPSEVAEGGLTEVKPLVPSQTVGFTKAGDGAGIQYYDQSDGKFYSVDEDGNKTVLADKVFHNVSNVTWSPNAEKAVIGYPDAAKIVFNFKTGEQATLPKHWDGVNFSPNSEKLVFRSEGMDPNNRWLAVSEDDGSGSRVLASLGDYGFSVISSWAPNNQSAALWTESAGVERDYVYFMGLNNENYKSLTVEGKGFEHIWNPSGKYILYSVYSTETDMKPQLWITRSDGENIGQGRRSIDIQTWAHKCVFTDEETAYCAVPDKLEEGAGMVPELATDTNDRIFKLDIRTGDKTLIAVPDGSYSVSSLAISDDGRNLFFVDGKTNQIDKVRLK